MSVLLGVEAAAGLNASALGLAFCEIPAGTYEVGAENFQDNPVRNVETGVLDLAETVTTNAQFATALKQLEKRNTILMTPLSNHRWSIVARGTVEEIKGVQRAQLVEIVAAMVSQEPRWSRVGDLSVKGGLAAFDLSHTPTRIVPVTLEAHLFEGFDGPNQPALTSAFEASAIAALFGLALPTGIEWEIAASDLRDDRYQYEEELRRVGHFYPANATADVKAKEPSRYGLYGMLGNVWVATANLYEEGKEDREFRGGSWINAPGDVHAALRLIFHPDFWHLFRGFRLLRPQD